MPSNRYWVWFFESRRWVDATAEGARNCFLSGGCEVAYGAIAPRRDGFLPPAFPPLIRPAIWANFVIRIRAHPTERARTGSTAGNHE